MTVVITGARGFIGRHLARLLAGKGETVIGLGHGQWPDANLWGVTRWVNGSVHEANLEDLAPRNSVGRIFHLAGGSSVGPSLANPREDFERTVLSTVHLVDWLRRSQPQAALALVSSAAVYGDSNQAHIAETAPLAPLSPYGHHKRMMEQLLESHAQSFGLTGSIARPFSVFGAGLTKQLLWDLGRRLVAGEDPATLGGTGEEARDFVHVEDVASALHLISLQASAAIPRFNVGSGQATTVSQIASLLAAGIGKGGIAFDNIYRPGNPARLVADSSRLRGIGWAPGISLEQGIASTARFIAGWQGGEA